MLKDYIPQLLSQFQIFNTMVNNLDSKLNSTTGIGGFFVKSQNVPAMVNAIAQMGKQMSQLAPKYTQMLDTLIDVMSRKGSIIEKRKIWDETLN